MATHRIKIADLYPYEPGAVRSSYDYHLAKYKAGEDVKPPVVLDLGSGLWMVVQGNNRVKSAKDAGILEMDFEIGSRPNLRPYSDTVQIRDRKQQKGFENYPIFRDEGERAKATMEEMKELGLAM
jgi:hypothetical protein